MTDADLPLRHQTPLTWATLALRQPLELLNDQDPLGVDDLPAPEEVFNALTDIEEGLGALDPTPVCFSCTTRASARCVVTA